MKNLWEEFYPTPSTLIEKMLKKLDFKKIENVLEPHAGKGNIADAILNHLKDAHWSRDESEQGNIDCIEINPDLKNILVGKGYRVIHDDFLKFRTHKRYDLIVMNPPFSNGEKHLLHAIDIMENGGTIVCILNANTLKCRHSNSRELLWQKLSELNASVEFLSDEFVSAERTTDVEIALIYIEIPNKTTNSFILENLQTKSYSEVAEECKDIVGGDFIAQIVQMYEAEVEAGIKLINEYKALLPHIKSSFEYTDCPTLELSIRNEGKYSVRALSVNAYVELVRLKYWNELFRNKKFTGTLTSNLQDELYEKVNALKYYDFSVYNILQIQKEIMSQMSRGVEETILELFDKLSAQHSWFPDSKKNIHYYSGWASNKAHKINKKVIIPIHGAFSTYSWAKDAFEVSTVYKVMQDLEKTLKYLETGDTVIVDDLLERLKICAQNGTTKRIPLRYFNITLYKKGTCHIEFTNLEMLEKLNIFGSQRKGWLPPNYGKKKYTDMSETEQGIINEFQGAEEYNRIMKEPSRYIIESPNVMLLGKVG